jgi:hypothetical protein
MGHEFDPEREFEPEFRSTDLQRENNWYPTKSGLVYHTVL